MPEQLDLYNLQDGAKGRAPGIYLDEVEQRNGERNRAFLEGREPDFDNMPTTTGQPLVGKAGLPENLTSNPAAYTPGMQRTAADENDDSFNGAEVKTTVEVRSPYEAMQEAAKVDPTVSGSPHTPDELAAGPTQDSDGQPLEDDNKGDENKDDDSGSEDDSSDTTTGDSTHLASTTPKKSAPAKKAAKKSVPAKRTSTVGLKPR